ncbi:MAG: hypothetical protein OWT27_10975 [Firmicutes bacterium]|nr:hypothetical protein [Bacillota bacterium]
MAGTARECGSSGVSCRDAEWPCDAASGMLLEIDIGRHPRRPGITRDAGRYRRHGG